MCLVIHVHTHVEQFFLGLKGVGGRFDIFYLVLFVLIKYSLIHKAKVREKFEILSHPSVFIQKHLEIKLFDQGKLYA